MAQPIDLAGDPDVADSRARLMIAMERLMTTVQRELLS